MPETLTLATAPLATPFHVYGSRNSSGNRPLPELAIRGAEVALETGSAPTAEHMMSQAPVVLLKFEDAVTAGGTAWRAIAFGVETPIGQWEGWLEFTPVGGELPSIATSRETTQPNRTDLDYWASGLSSVYLEGALQRAIARDSASEMSDDARAAPRKARRPGRRPPPANSTGMRRHAVLDPFAVYAQGEDVLRKELRALSPDHLEAIVDAYDLEGAHSLAAEGSDRTSDRLIAAILAAVKNSAHVPNR